MCVCDRARERERGDSEREYFGKLVIAKAEK